MKFKLTHKLLAAHVLSIVLLTLIFLILSHRSNQSMLSRAMNGVDEKVMVQLARTLGENYVHSKGFQLYVQDNQVWRNIVDQHFFEVFFSLTPPSSETDGPSGPVGFKPPDPACEPPFAPFFDRLALLDRNKDVIIPANVQEQDRHLRKIKSNGKTVGWLEVGKLDFDIMPLAEQFFDQQLRISTWASLAGGLVALLLGYVMSRHIISPIRRLTDAAGLIAKRQFDFSVEVSTRDELQRLAESFNAMSGEVVRHEKLQKQWLMDISHELRTPLTILMGEVSAMRDRITPCDSAALDSLQEEISKIKRLVDDLYDLSVIDKQGFSLDREMLDLTKLVGQQAQLYRDKLKQRNIALEFRAPGRPMWIWADGDRLNQVIRNTLENCWRYSDEAGMVVVSLAQQQQNVTVKVSDSGPGVRPELLVKLFDRLYRIEEGRIGQRGGSGVGLTICKKIIEAHAGEIVAGESELGGLTITIKLPLGNEA